VSTGMTQSSANGGGEGEEAATLAAALVGDQATASSSSGAQAAQAAAKTSETPAAAAASSGEAPPASAGEPGGEAAASGEALGGEQGAEDRAPEDEEVGSDAGLGGGGASSRRRHRRNFSQSQLSEMLRNHAFSSGFQTYKQFIRKVEPSRSESSFRLRGDRMAELETQRKTFFGREAHAFGVELTTAREAEKWEATVRSLGPRSASEGALLRYAHSAVEDMTRSVNDSLGVDVSRVSRKQIKRPSFVQRMDIGGVSTNPMDPMSATGQAVRRLCPSTVTLPPVDARLGAGERGGQQGPGTGQLAGGRRRGSKA